MFHDFDIDPFKPRKQLSRTEDLTSQIPKTAPIKIPVPSLDNVQESVFELPESISISVPKSAPNQNNLATGNNVSLENEDRRTSPVDTQEIDESDSSDTSIDSASNTATMPPPPPQSLRLPSFTPDSPDLFFILMEASLKSQGVTDGEQVFLATLMQLPQRVQMQARQLVSATIADEPDKLTKLKAIVDGIYTLPDEEKLKKLLATTSMGDMKPSEYLNHIRELQGATADKNSPLIRTYFMQSLPNTIAPLVHLLLDTKDLDSIAAAADKSLAYCNINPTTISAVTVTDPKEDVKMDPQIAALTHQINQIKFTQSQKRDQFDFESQFSSFKSEMNRKLDALNHQMEMQMDKYKSLQDELHDLRRDIRYSRGSSRGFNDRKRDDRKRSNSSNQHQYQ